MNLELKPELQRFIDDQVNEGHFASRAEVVEAAIARLMLDPQSDDLEADELLALKQSIEQMRRGEVLDWRAYSAKIRQQYLEG